MEARQRQVKDWLTKVRTRQILLPRFQRFEAWGSREIASFLTSIVRHLPVGSLLTLGVAEEKPPFISRAISGAPQKGEKVNELLLDGQQRVTTLWRSLNDNYPDKTYFVDIKDGKT